MADSNIRIAVFETAFVEQSVDVRDFVSDAHKCLVQYDSIRSRLMPLGDDSDNVEKDFIPSFRYDGGYLFGSIARMAAGVESSVSSVILDKKSASLNEMVSEANANSEGTISKSAFFCAYKNLVAITNRGFTRKALEDYSNWMFENNGMENHTIRISPKMNTAAEIPLGEIASVQIAGDYIGHDAALKNQTVTLANSILGQLIDVMDLKGIDLKNILSAVLTIKLNKKELEAQDALGVALKLSDDVIVIGKNHKRINGTQYIVSATRRIAAFAGGMYNEQQIETAMREIIQKVLNGEVVS